MCAVCYLRIFLTDILTPSRSSWDPDDLSIGRGSSKWDIPSPAPSRDSGIDTKRLTNRFGHILRFTSLNDDRSSPYYSLEMLSRENTLYFYFCTELVSLHLPVPLFLLPHTSTMPG